MTKRVLLIVVAVMMALVLSAVAAQDDIDPEKYAKVKAGMVLNFLRYTTWPQTSFEEEDSPVVITVLGHDPMADELEELIDETQLNGRRIEMRRIDYPRSDPRTGDIDRSVINHVHEELRQSHLLYIASTEQGRYRGILEELEGEALLTVSDMRGFARGGGMLGLAVRRGRVAFDANIDAIEKSPLKVSSKLLRLASIVRTGQEH